MQIYSSKGFVDLSSFSGKRTYSNGFRLFTLLGTGKSKHHGFRHRIAQMSAMRKGRFTGRSSRFGL